MLTRYTHFTEGPQNHEQTAKEEVSPRPGCTVSTCTSPTHEIHTQRREGEEESNESPETG
jgi:hypothetical protein